MAISLPSTVSLHGLTAIVTGGSRGIGKGIALELASRGASVAIVYANPNKTNIAQETVSEIKAQGKDIKAIAILADLTESSSYERIVKETLTGLNTNEINILVHNAAIASTASISDMTFAHFDSIISTNVRGPVFLTQAALPHIPRGGRIIFISSISARAPNPSLSVSLYAASKAAEEALARDWAYELGHSRGITVNAVQPGMVETDILDALPADVKASLMESSSSVTAAGPRIGTVDDVAQIVAFLASEGSRWVTGSTISASGGRIVF